MELFLLTMENDHYQTEENESTSTWYEGIFNRATPDTYLLEECIEVLLSYGLLQERSGQSYSMHKLVHAWLFDRFPIEEQFNYNIASLFLLRNAIEEGDQRLGARQRLVPHVMANFDIESKASLQDAQRIVSLVLLGKNGGYFSGIGRWADALSVKKYVYSKTLILQGEEHPYTIPALNNLAITLADQGKVLHSHHST